MASDLKKQTIIIIGAPRLGTNILRDSLISIKGMCTWPCDEINYIWRYGNRSYPNDEIPALLLKPNNIEFIRHQFDKIRRYNRCDFIVEKTCANSLRVPYVDKVVPNAKYIFIVRDGRDVVSSAMQKWNSSVDPSYIMAKLRYIPLRDIPFYAMTYFMNRLRGGILNNKRRLLTWGPRFKDMERIANAEGLAAVCAAQWSRCVLLAKEAFEKIDRERVCIIKYEDFVLSPKAEFLRLSEFSGVKPSDQVIDKVVDSVSPASVGKGRAFLGKENLDNLRMFLQPALEWCGYER